MHQKEQVSHSNMAILTAIPMCPILSVFESKKAKLSLADSKDIKFPTVQQLFASFKQSSVICISGETQYREATGNPFLGL